MSKLTKDDVLHVAKLAKLDLKETEIEKFLKQLTNIVDHISELSGIDTDGIEPTAQTTGLENIFRNDEVNQSSLDQDSALSGSDKTYNGYFKVKAILEGRTDK